MASRPVRRHERLHDENVAAIDRFLRKDGTAGDRRPVSTAALELLTALEPVLARWGRWYLFGAQAVSSPNEGTRVTVYDVLEYLGGDMTEPQLLHDLPDLTQADIRATLAFAAARERRETPVRRDLLAILRVVI